MLRPPVITARKLTCAVEKRSAAVGSDEFTYRRREYSGMVSRREVLTTSCAALVSTGIAGCSRLNLGSAKTGYLQLKTVTLRWDHDVQTYED